MDSTVQICLVCQTPLDPDEEVIQAVYGSPSDAPGEGMAHRHTAYVHVGEDAQVIALGGWTISGRGRLRDLTSKDLTESSDRL